MTKDFVELVKQALNDVMPSYTKEEEDLWRSEIYVDYRDEISDEDAMKIAADDYPEQALWEILDYAYMEQDSYNRGQILKEVKDWFEEGEYEYDPDELNDVFNDMVYAKLPDEYFLNQEFLVDILVDTGDANYDYTLNPRIYPCWYSHDNKKIEDKASLLWLTRQQGYSKTEMKSFLNNGKETYDNDTFPLSWTGAYLQSVYNELANLGSHMGQLTFLVKMTLADLIELNKLIKAKDRNGRFHDATKNPYCGYIILDKSTETGLYDKCYGGGSLFEINLEKDVRLPIRFISKAIPDKCLKPYNIKEVYGMCGSVWRETVKQIHAPKSAHSKMA